MERVVFVEVLDRRGRVRLRLRLDSYPATIGRAYTNSIILDDKRVCPEHVRIARDDDGTLFAEDLGSVNGMYQYDPLQRLQRIEVRPDTHIRIGHTVLRFRDAEFSVAPTLAEQTEWRRLPRLIENSYTAVGIFLLCLGVLLLDFYLGSYERITPANVLGVFFATLVLFTVWAGIWSFVNRLLTYRFRFLSHVALAGVVLVLYTVVAASVEYYEFLYEPGAVADGLELTMLTLLFFLLLFGHLSIIASLSLRKRTIASLLVAVGIFGTIGFMTYLEQTEFSHAIASPARLKPVGKNALTPVSADAFFSDLETIKLKIDREAADE